jgi:hypothetical protein
MRRRPGAMARSDSAPVRRERTAQGMSYANAQAAPTAPDAGAPRVWLWPRAWGARRNDTIQGDIYGIA